MQDLNLAIFERLNGLSSDPLIARITPIIADFPIFFLPIFLWGLWLYYTFSAPPHPLKKWEETSYKDKKRLELMHIFYACLLGMILSFIIKQFVDIERPESYIESTKDMLLGRIPEKSFPSDHATISFAFTIALLFTKFYKVGYIFLPFVIVMNISRIIVWVHWPLDIFAWTILWTVSAIIFFTYFRRLKLVKSLDESIIKLMKYLHLY